jgi:hypothetical protein
MRTKQRIASAGAPFFFAARISGRGFREHDGLSANMEPSRRSLGSGKAAIGASFRTGIERGTRASGSTPALRCVAGGRQPGAALAACTLVISLPPRRCLGGHGTRCNPGERAPVSSISWTSPTLLFAGVSEHSRGSDRTRRGWALFEVDPQQPADVQPRKILRPAWLVAGPHQKPVPAALGVEAFDIDALDLAFRSAFDAKPTADDLGFVWHGGVNRSARQRTRGAGGERKRRPALATRAQGVVHWLKSAHRFVGVSGHRMVHLHQCDRGDSGALPCRVMQ